MIIIQNGKVYTMTGKILDPGNIVIENGKIISVDEKIPADIPADTVVIDAKGLWILPGLIQAHCHIGITEDRKGMVGDYNDTKSPLLLECPLQHYYEKNYSMRCNIKIGNLLQLIKMNHLKRIFEWNHGYPFWKTKFL